MRSQKTVTTQDSSEDYSNVAALFQDKLRSYILACQDEETGGFADRPGDMVRVIIFLTFVTDLGKKNQAADGLQIRGQERLRGQDLP